MLKSLVLTIMGPDRPGIVEELSETIGMHGGNWTESRMARLANQFTGLLLANVPEKSLDALRKALAALDEQDLYVSVQTVAAETERLSERVVLLELVGQDRPGIVREISHLLATQGVSIEDLETHVSSASWSGETLFRARAQLRTPDALDTDELNGLLEEIANELMIDINLADQ